MDLRRGGPGRRLTLLARKAGTVDFVTRVVRREHVGERRVLAWLEPSIFYPDRCIIQNSVSTTPINPQASTAYPPSIIVSIGGRIP